MLVEMNKHYFYHNIADDVKIVACVHKHCELAKKINSIKSDAKDLKNILAWE
jgi:hypothetical protein